MSILKIPGSLTGFDDWYFPMTTKVSNLYYSDSDKWTQRFIRVALEIATWSKDPRRGVGCVIIDDDKNQLSGGFNGFPRGVLDDERLLDKEKKLEIIVHAEANAVAAAARNGHSLKGSTAYITSRPCCQCTSLLIQAGVKYVVCIDDGKWTDNCAKALVLLNEAGVGVRQIIRDVHSSLGQDNAS